MPCKNLYTFLVADSWIDTTIGVKVLCDSVLEVVDRDGLCIFERQSSGFDPTAPCYDIEVTSYANRVTITSG